MRERQEEVGGRVGVQDALVERHGDHRAIVAVGDDAALRRPGGARRVDERADVVGGDRLPALLPLGVRAARAGLDQLIHRDCAAARALHPDHSLELGDPITYLVDLGELFIVLDDHRLGVGVLDDVLAFLGRVRLVDRDDGGAHAEGREVEVGPLGAGVREDRDLVALLDSELDQAECELPDDLADLPVGLRDPLPGLVLVGDRREVRMPLGGERHQVRTGLAVGTRFRGGPGRRNRRALHVGESIRTG